MSSSLTEGKNSYITIDEADAYINLQYLKYTPLRTIWSVLNADEKDSYLFSAMRELEVLPVTGQKLSCLQPLQFPRRGFGGIIPQEVKAAQVEIALAFIEMECAAQANKQFATMQSLGAMKNIKYSKRDVSDAMLGGMVEGVTTRKEILSSEKAELLMRRFQGVFRG